MTNISQPLLDRALIKASRQNDVAEIKSLLLQGADPLVHYSEPVVNAILDGSKELLDLYLVNGYSPSSNNSVAFIKALENNKYDLFKVLLEKEVPDLIVIHHVNQCGSAEVKELVNQAFNNQVVEK